MKKNKKTLIYSILVIMCLSGLFLIVGTPHYQSIKITTRNNYYFKNQIIEQARVKQEVDIKECTDFEWDEFYVFPPYYPTASIFEEVGVEWTELRTYLGYLIFNGMEHETVSEGQNLIVFKKGDKIIMSDIYFMPISFEYVANNYSPLKVSAGESIFIVNEANEVFVFTKKE